MMSIPLFSFWVNGVFFIRPKGWRYMFVWFQQALLHLGGRGSVPFKKYVTDSKRELEDAERSA